MEQRRFLPTLSELIDRLSIVQLKEVFIPEHKEAYAQEIADITHDIQLILSEKDVVITGGVPIAISEISITVDTSKSWLIVVVKRTLSPIISAFEIDNALVVIEFTEPIKDLVPISIDVR